MGKTFAQTFDDAVRRIGSNTYQDMERDRVHRETVRDNTHAYRDVEMKKPDPWRRNTGLTL